MKRKMLSVLFCVAIALAVVLFSPADAAVEKTPFITSAATTAEEVLSAWASGNHNYIKLGADLELSVNGQDLVVDLAGKNLTVNGTGELSAFDSANDTYDHLACGVLMAGEGISYAADFAAPNGLRYVALTEGNYVTFHRLEMKIKTVTLRTSSAGLYYKAQYRCDRQVEQAVTAYGVVVSLQNVPGADFKSVQDDAYTVTAENFVSGATVTSGSVVGIMKEGLSAAENLNRSRMPIYANAYIDLGNGPIMADTDNIGTRNGTSASLMQVVLALDAAYPELNATTKGQLDAFYKKWNAAGVAFDVQNMGKEKKSVDNSNLVFDEGTTKAWCPVCEKKIHSVVYPVGNGIATITVISSNKKEAICEVNVVK